MLQSLLPKAHNQFQALPLLGPVVDGFDDWLAANGYTPGSRRFAIRTLIHADSDLRGRGVLDIHKLSRATLYDSWRDLIEVFPNNAGTVRTLARYLNFVGSPWMRGPKLSRATLYRICRGARKGFADADRLVA